MERQQFITGAGSGIGRATADELAKQNISAIALVDLSSEVFNVESPSKKPTLSAS